ncbi:MAG: VWA domain-containing protein [Sandaracinaceae bacterium]
MDDEHRGPAEILLQSLLTYTDHLYHNRPGVVVADRTVPIGLRWSPVTHREEGGDKVVYRLEPSGRGSRRVRVGVMQGEEGAEGTAIVEGGRRVGHYRRAGIFPEVARYLYGQIAEVWKLDNEFVARWGSFAFGQEHRDLKVVLAAFLLCQSRKGDPEREGDEILFHDADYRDVGEAMCLVRLEQRDFNPKMLLRVREVLVQPGVAALNRDLGFGRSARRPFLGRWPKAVEKWLRYREQNPAALEGLVRQGFRTSVIRLAQLVGYKPEGEAFFQTLRWKQTQAKDGRRSLALDVEVADPDSWEGLSEEEIGERILRDKPSYKVLTSKVPSEIGLTPAILAAAIEAGCLSPKDLVIATPTLEELGLLAVEEIRARWEAAVKAAEDQRASNIARRVRSEETREKLEEAADGVLQRAVEEVTRNLRVYVFVDISGSMSVAIDAAKGHLERFVQGFPLDRLHVAVFNTVGREVTIPHPSAAGVRAAFKGYTAGGGTSYGAGVQSLAKRPPAPDEDTLFIFVGDELATDFPDSVRASGLRPMAFGLLKGGQYDGHAVTRTAAELGIPCFSIDDKTFQDPYAIPRTVRALVAATPVGVPTGGGGAPRVNLVQQILDTELLEKPVWAG